MHRSQPQAEGCRGLLLREAEEEVPKEQNLACLVRQTTECGAHIGYVVGFDRPVGIVVERKDDSSSTTDVGCLVRSDSRQPRPGVIHVPQTRQTSPRCDEGLLQRIARLSRSSPSRTARNR